MDVLIPVTIGAIVIVAIVAMWRLLAPSPHDQGSTPTPDPTPPRPDPRSIYDRLGPALIRTAVDQFYHRVLGDPRLAPYFTGVDLSRLRRHQALFIGQLLGGPVHYQTHQIAAMHRRLRVGADVYWAAGAHLLAVLSGMKASREVLQRICDALLDLEPLVVDGDRRVGS